MLQLALNGNHLTRSLSYQGHQISTYLDVGLNNSLEHQVVASDPLGAWWQLCLQGATPEPVDDKDVDATPLRVVELFSGVGGLLVGIKQFASEAGRQVTCEAAVDIDTAALEVHSKNHATRRVLRESVSSMVDFRVRNIGTAAEFVYPPELIDESLADSCKEVDVVSAGPPCQGHSNLNNHSRRDDPRNLLYLTVPAFAVACAARTIIIENVSSVVNDKTQVVQTSRALLEASGYVVTDGLLSADVMGWPQTRKRHFLVASRGCDDPNRGSPVPIKDVVSLLADSPPRSVMWAINSQNRLSTETEMHTKTKFVDKTQARIDWLFDNGEHNLALEQRPDCHKNGSNYTAVYGRMYKDRPAPTITTGFMTPGCGRFVHPLERRTLLPAEAARLQGFPNQFKFFVGGEGKTRRAQLAKWIGDAVAMPLGYGAAVSALLRRVA